MASLFCQTGSHIIEAGVHSAVRPARLTNPAVVTGAGGSADWVYDDDPTPEAMIRVCFNHPLKGDPYVWIDARPPRPDVVLNPNEARALKAVLDAMRYSRGGGNQQSAMTLVDAASDLFAARTALRGALVRAGWEADPQDPGESPTQLMRLALMDVMSTWGDRRLGSKKRAVIDRVKRALYGDR